MQNWTVAQIKQQSQALGLADANIVSLSESERPKSTIPSIWVTDWLLHVVDKPAAFLITDPNYQLTDSEIEQFNAGLIKMQQGTPLAYLTGHQAFWSLDFQVNAHTLIPRPDTEVLVERVLDWIHNQSSDVSKLNAKRLLDLGTGSGCIGISLAHELASSGWQVLAVDISVEALKVAQTNAIDNRVDNIEFMQSSWYDTLVTHTEQLFEVIVSNPPYIDESDLHLSRLQSEPISALTAPNHGLADIEHIVRQAPTYLKADGLLAIEHGYDQGASVRQLFLNGGFKSVKTIQDYGGNDRVTLGQKLL